MFAKSDVEEAKRMAAGCAMTLEELSNDRRLESIPDQIKELYRRIGSANKYTSFVAAPQCTLSLNLSDVSAIGIRVSALQCFGTLRSKRYSQINVP